MAENEIWFRHKSGLVIVGLPVHWKGWLTGALYALALLSVIFLIQSLETVVGGDDLFFLRLIGIVVGVMLTLAFLWMAWPHRGTRDGGR